eukprot:PhF_6_TR21708/c0_g1_i2/m.31007
MEDNPHDAEHDDEPVVLFRVDTNYGDECSPEDTWYVSPSESHFLTTDRPSNTDSSEYSVRGHRSEWGVDSPVTRARDLYDVTGDRGEDIPNNRDEEPNDDSFFPLSRTEVKSLGCATTFSMDPELYDANASSYEVSRDHDFVRIVNCTAAVLLGKGNNTVWLARCKLTCEPVAVKLFRRTDPHVSLSLEEHGYHREFASPNIVPALNYEVVQIDPSGPVYECLVLKRMRCVLTLRGGPARYHEFGEIAMDKSALIQKRCKGILLGLHHIHRKGYVHNDIKPQNIMVDD